MSLHQWTYGGQPSQPFATLSKRKQAAPVATPAARSTHPDMRTQPPLSRPLKRAQPEPDSCFGQPQPGSPTFAWAWPGDDRNDVLGENWFQARCLSLKEHAQNMQEWFSGNTDQPPRWIDPADAAPRAQEFISQGQRGRLAKGANRGTHLPGSTVAARRGESGSSGSARPGVSQGMHAEAGAQPQQGQPPQPAMDGGRSDAQCRRDHANEDSGQAILEAASQGTARKRQREAPCAPEALHAKITDTADAATPSRPVAGQLPASPTPATDAAKEQEPGQEAPASAPSASRVAPPGQGPISLLSLRRAPTKTPAGHGTGAALKVGQPAAATTGMAPAPAPAAAPTVEGMAGQDPPCSVSGHSQQQIIRDEQQNPVMSGDQEGAEATAGIEPARAPSPVSKPLTRYVSHSKTKLPELWLNIQHALQ